MTVPERLSALRKIMKEKGITMLIVPPRISIKANMLESILKRECLSPDLPVLPELLLSV